MIVTLVFVFRTIFSIGESWRTAELIREVIAVPVTVTAKLLFDAVTRGALELASRTGVGLALGLVRAVIAVIVLVTLPPGRDALVIATLEL